VKCASFHSSGAWNSDEAPRVLEDYALLPSTIYGGHCFVFCTCIVFEIIKKIESDISVKCVKICNAVPL
jgi:hypothetical protein